MQADGRAVDAPAAADAGATPPMTPAPPDATGQACRRDEDCRLVNDCCTCAAIRRDENAPTCDPNRSCVTAVCAQYPGIERARCAAGRCVLGFDCDTTTVLCKRLAPVCPAGQVPRVTGPMDARCYGECVDARECLSVPSCMGCGPTDRCMADPSSPKMFHCLAAAGP